MIQNENIFNTQTKWVRAQERMSLDYTHTEQHFWAQKKAQT